MSVTIAVPAPAQAHRVKDDLNRESLPQSQRDPGRKLAWMNALCATTLAVGILLREDAQQFIFHPAPVEVTPVFNEEFIPEPPKTQQDQAEEEPLPETAPDIPVLPTVVAPDKAQVNFTVEVTGPTVTKADVSKIGPPPRETKRAAPAPSGPVVFRGDEQDGGYYPEIEPRNYPQEAKLRREEGSGEVFVVVAEDGTPSKVETRVTSGSVILDRAMGTQIRRFWRWPAKPGGGLREYRVPFEFRLR